MLELEIKQATIKVEIDQCLNIPPQNRYEEGRMVVLKETLVEVQDILKELTHE